jgi:hypothetical protein
MAATMATRVLLTIDTELTWRHFAQGADWRDNFTLSCEPCGVGLAYQLEMLRRHALDACFFVDPMPALVYGSEPIKRMVEPILEAGQEVQLHLHSFWHDLAQGNGDKARFELTEFDAAEQRALIETARALLVEAGAPAPVAFRSGSFAADANTLTALATLGISYDSSHNGADHPWPSALPLDAAQIDPIACHGVIEVPVGQIRRPDGGLRPLQLCALSSAEMQAALHHADRNHHRLTTIVSHSFELATRDGKRVNRLVRGRFDSLCAFLDANRETMATTRFAALPPALGTLDAVPLPPDRGRIAWRMAEQAWGAIRYEQPAIAAGIAAAPPLIALAGMAVYAD